MPITKPKKNTGARARKERIDHFVACSRMLLPDLDKYLQEINYDEAQEILLNMLVMVRECKKTAWVDGVDEFQEI